MLDRSIGLRVVIVYLKNTGSLIACYAFHSLIVVLVSVTIVQIIYFCGLYCVPQAILLIYQIYIWNTDLPLFGWGLDLFQFLSSFLSFYSSTTIIFKNLKLWKRSSFIILSLQSILSQFLVHIFLYFPLDILNTITIILQIEQTILTLFKAYFQLPCESFLIGPNF